MSAGLVPGCWRRSLLCTRSHPAWTLPPLLSRPVAAWASRRSFSFPFLLPPALFHFPQLPSLASLPIVSSLHPAARTVECRPKHWSRQPRPLPRAPGPSPATQPPIDRTTLSLLLHILLTTFSRFCISFDSTSGQNRTASSALHPPRISLLAHPNCLLRERV